MSESAGVPTLGAKLKKRFKLGFCAGLAFAVPYCGHKAYKTFGYRGGKLVESVAVISFGVAFNAAAGAALFTYITAK